MQVTQFKLDGFKYDCIGTPKEDQPPVYTKKKTEPPNQPVEKINRDEYEKALAKYQKKKKTI